MGGEVREADFAIDTAHTRTTGVLAAGAGERLGIVDDVEGLRVGLSAHRRALLQGPRGELARALREGAALGARACESLVHGEQRNRPHGPRGRRRAGDDAVLGGRDLDGSGVGAAVAHQGALAVDHVGCGVDLEAGRVRIALVGLGLHREAEGLAGGDRDARPHRAGGHVLGLRGGLGEGVHGHLLGR